jgi:hypothetical protein
MPATTTRISCSHRRARTRSHNRTRRGTPIMSREGGAARTGRPAVLHGVLYYEAVTSSEQRVVPASQTLYRTALLPLPPGMSVYAPEFAVLVSSPPFL